MNFETTDSKKPVILITGASSGIGAATARLFAQNGYRVALAARRVNRLEALAQEIQSSGGQAIVIVTDISQLEQVQQMARSVIEQFGRVDLLFNNAGFGRLNWLENMDPLKDVQAQIDVNLTGLIWSAQAVLPHMIEQKSGHIINMASMAGLIAPPTYSVYAATKFAVRGFSQALRREVGVFGVRVSTICPGGVDTEFEERAKPQRKTGFHTPGFLMLSSEQVARAVYNLARRPRRTLVLPWPFLWASWGNALFPGLYDWVIQLVFTRRER